MAQYQPAQQPYPRTVVPWGGILATTGAVVLALALFLPWRSLTIEFLGESVTGSTNGFEQWEGVIAALVTLAALVLGILSMTLRTRATRKGMGIALISAGGLTLLLSVIALFRNVDTLGAGMFVAMVGALLVAAGGVLALLEASRLPERPAPRSGQPYYPQQYQQPPPGQPPAG